MNWYEFNQNNSGGSFIVDDKVCHTLYIEAETHSEAILKAEDLGCYWNGVVRGLDCPCCGDRWSNWDDIPINLEKYNAEGYEARVNDGIYPNTSAEWDERYGKYEIIDNPRIKTTTYSREYSGKIRLRNIEEYAQLMADEYGWTTPDARIYYANGEVKEIFSKGVS